MLRESEKYRIQVNVGYTLYERLPQNEWKKTQEIDQNTGLAMPIVIDEAELVERQQAVCFTGNQVKKSHAVEALKEISKVVVQEMKEVGLIIGYPKKFTTRFLRGAYRIQVNAAITVMEKLPVNQWQKRIVNHKGVEHEETVTEKEREIKQFAVSFCGYDVVETRAVISVSNLINTVFNQMNQSGLISTFN